MVKKYYKRFFKRAGGWQMISAVIFDMDGLMFDTERIMKDGWMHACEILDFHLTEEQLSQMRGGTRERNRMLFEQWFQGRISYDQGREIRTRYQEIYIDQYGVPVKKGLVELLDYLSFHQIPAAIATSTNRKSASRYWDMAGITSYFSASVCGDEVLHGKPDPEIFLAAAQKMQTPPAQCLILEDSITGIRAAKAAGSFACMVPDLTPPTEELRRLCDFICQDLAQVIPYLDSFHPEHSV